MALTPRQVLAYKDTVDLYSLAQTTSLTTGLRTAKTYALVASAVPCLFKIRQSVEAPSPMGRVESDNMFSLDEIHFDHAQAIDSDWVIVNKSLAADGSQSQNYGRYWICRGQPASIPSHGGRRANVRIVQAVQVKKPPAGVPYPVP
jgi:hypothetical protein